MTKPLSIIVVNDFAHVNGGAGRVALASALALSQRGHAVTIFSAVAPIMGELREKGIKLVCTHQQQIRDDPNRLRAARQGLWNRQAALRMKSLLRGANPADTIVHVHAWTKSLSSSFIPVVQRAGFPVVITMHDYFLACPNGGFYNYQKNQVCRLRPLSRSCLLSNCDKKGYAQKLWRVGRQVIQQRCGQLPAGIRHFIAISDFSRAILEPYLSRQARIYDVPNPIFVTRCDPALPGENKGFVFVGRLDPEKGPMLFAEAAAKTGERPLFIGAGPCHEKVRQVNPQAVITGWLAPQRVTAALARARALVFPSLWYETQGLVVLEAAALGIPAIVSDSSAARQAVEDGVTGLVFRSGDADDLSRNMAKLKDSALTARMGKAAYMKYWRNPSTIESHVERLEEVYRSVRSTEVRTPQLTT